MNIAHVAQIEISRSSGMGRVAWHWRAELERRGHRFLHVGRQPLGRDVHPALYPYHAWAAVRRRAAQADLILAHEPAAALFARGHVPLVVFSHGIERRGWAVAGAYRHLSGERLPLRSRLLFPLWRLRACDRALRHATGALVVNREDLAYCLEHYGRRADSTFQFRNGVDAAAPRAAPAVSAPPTILFLGSWIPRKGIRTLVEAAKLLHARGARPRWLLAGTGRTRDQVLALWPRELHDAVEVVPGFEPGAEAEFHARATVFVLPSFFEGQPLALLQALAAGIAVVASDTCGQRDLVVHERNGLLFRPGDAAFLADQLMRCLADAALRHRLGSAARASVADRAWERVATEVADFIEAVHAAGTRPLLQPGR